MINAASSDYQLNQDELDYCFDLNKVDKFFVMLMSSLCQREGKWKLNISPTQKTNLSAGLICSTIIYIHILKDVGVWVILKVVLLISHPCCPNHAKMLKQHSTIENNDEVGIRPSKTYQSFVTATGDHRELSFIEKDVRNYITREVCNVFELDGAKEFGKYLLRMKEKNHI
ncbi:hypothetical protein Ahy_B10g101868 isoform B [Arachis hypogaea]|uniref:Uncharacterized protein n=1 Tax=Arachis hypogaea TaxID=3818 RepID=A0A444X0I5_ARAHY|nr:hypothetical protein Ahy_B10g101868 isoform B [Arachis hypogaea]